MEKVNLEKKFALFNEHWSPKIVGELNESYIKLAKIQGEFVWHKHDNEDEMFFVVKGRLVIRFRDKDVVLNPGEFLIIPRGVEHMPVADQEVWIMLVEPKTTVNTGDVQDEKTQTQEQRI
ncbi:MAG: cupin domain-containing protein [Desulfovibrio sp.]|nr:MAG: cupin domain-containing protein [Desulfovibrio sp.]